MAAMTVSEVKILLLIPETNTKYDDFLTTLLPIIESFVQRYCNRDFLNTDTGEIDYPDGIKMVIAQMCRYHIKESQMQLDAIRANNNTMLPQYPSDLLSVLRQWRRVRFVTTKGDVL